MESCLRIRHCFCNKVYCQRTILSQLSTIRAGEQLFFFIPPKFSPSPNFDPQTYYCFLPTEDICGFRRKRSRDTFTFTFVQSALCVTNVGIHLIMIRLLALKFDDMKSLIQGASSHAKNHILLKF